MNARLRQESIIISLSRLPSWVFIYDLLYEAHVLDIINSTPL